MSHLFLRCLHGILAAVFFCSFIAAAAPSVEFLSDNPEISLGASLGLGELGLDVAAHKAGVPGLPLRIGTNTFAKGLGHHANGAITVVLSGDYTGFDAQAGIQKQKSAKGSVVFRVFVDGEKRFDSGVMRQADGAKPIHVSVQGAQELRLEASDAGDGITCDMANWAEARLTRAKAASASAHSPAVDVAQFARVVSWDPNRNDGCRASRIEEFHAEDLFLETGLEARKDGSYLVSPSTNGQGCIGLQWLNQRAIKSLAIEFANPAGAPDASAVSVQGWFGESAWQGQWKPLEGDIKRDANRLEFTPVFKSLEGSLLQTRKIRWLFPAPAKPVAVRKLSAFTRARWDTMDVFIQAEGKSSGTAEVRIFNGEVIGLAKPSWDMSRPLRLRILYSRLSSLKSDSTVLRFRLPQASLGVAVDDLLANDCVYVPDAGLFVAREPLKISMADYKRRIAPSKTILEKVREMPDQTLAQAMEKTHNPIQKMGPVMLSLSCDNTKFVVERQGAVQFQTSPQTNTHKFTSDFSMNPEFAAGAISSNKFTRHLDGGWLPIPVIAAEHQGVVYSQRSFVAPVDEAGAEPARLMRRSVFVSEFSFTNLADKAVSAAFSLGFVSTSKEKQPVEIKTAGRGYLVSSGNTPLALIDTRALGMEAKIDAGTIRFTGEIPPGAAARCAAFIPGEGETLSENAPWQAASLRDETERYWNVVLEPAIEVGTPDVFLNRLIRSSQVRCLIDSRSEAAGARIAAWISAPVYGPLESESHAIIRGMDLMGHSDFARRSLDFFIARYNTNGFLTTGYTLFGTGWHLWTLGEHYQINRDTDWLRRAAPEVARVGRWIVSQAEKTKKLTAGDDRGRSVKVPEYGLVPPGVIADWNAFAYHFALNAYYCAALREIGTALTDIKHPDARVFLKKSAEMRANILRAYQWTQGQSPVLPLGNGTWIPAYPSQVHSPGKLGDYFPGQDSGRSWGYDVEIGAIQLIPTGVLDPKSREAVRIIDHMEDIQFLADGWSRIDYLTEANHKDWFNLGGFSKIQPYYTRNCEVYAMWDDVKPFVRSYFNTLAAMVSPEVMTFWEHFNNRGAWDKTHETAYFLEQTRSMLVHERGDELWLASLITSNWLEDGLGVSVRTAPTRFGKVSYRIDSRLSENRIEARIEPPSRRAPSAIVLRLRHPRGLPIKSVTVNGKSHRDFDPARQCVRIKPSAAQIVVQASY